MGKAASSPLRKVAYISSGIPAIDVILGGGLQTGTVTQFSGEHSTGKSTIAYMAIATAQKEGRSCIYFDTEHKFAFDFAESLGVNLKKLDYEHELLAEDLFDAAEKYARKEGAFIIVDSIGGLLARKTAESENGTSFPEVPKLIPAFMLRLTLALAIHRSTALLMNHEKRDFEGRLKVLGGVAIPYHSTNWIRFRKTNGPTVLRGTKEYSRSIEVSVQKGVNRGAKTVLAQLAKGGFDFTQSLIDEALESGVLKKDGNTYMLGEEKLAVGLGKLRELVATDESLEERIRSLS